MKLPVHKKKGRSMDQQASLVIQATGGRELGSCETFFRIAQLKPRIRFFNPTTVNAIGTAHNVKGRFYIIKPECHGGRAMAQPSRPRTVVID